MMGFIRAVILVVVGIAVLSLSVANRHTVRLVLDPFIDRNVAFSVEVPLFLCLFAALILGVVLGAITMWFGQGYWRRTARNESREAAIWRREAETLKRSLRGSPRFEAAISGSSSYR